MNDKGTSSKDRLQEVELSYQNTVESNKINGTMNLRQVVELIKGEKFNNQIETLRSFRQKDQSYYKQQKLKLPAILFAGVFNVSRSNNNCNKGSGLAAADVDKIESQNMQELFEILTGLSYSVLVFRSPSNAGFKVVFRIPETTDESMYRDLGTAFSNLLITKVGNLAEVDIRANKDISRACFFSCDSDIYENYLADTWTQRAGKSTQTMAGTINGRLRPQRLEQLIGADLHNTDLMGAVSSLMRAGNDSKAIMQFFKDHVAEIMPNSGDRDNWGKLSSDLNKMFEKVDLTNFEPPPPRFPDEILDRLPRIFRQCLDIYDNIEIRKDVLPSLFVYLGYLFRSWRILVGGKLYAPTIQLFTLGESGSGKEVTQDGLALLNPIIERLEGINNEDWNKFCKDKEAHKLKIRAWRDEYKKSQDKAGDPPEEPPEPPIRRVVIGGDITKPKLLQALADNPEGLIWQDAEAQTVSISNSRRDHGGIKDVERKLYDHSSISQARVDQKANYSISFPVCSIHRSGTPSQYKDEFRTAEMGGLQRFETYVVQQKPIRFVVVDNTREQWTKTGMEIISQIEATEFIQFYPTQGQMDRLSKYAWELEAKYTQSYHGTRGIPTRTARRVFRKAMILELANDYCSKIITDEILELAIDIDRVMIANLFWAMKYIDDPEESISKSEKKRRKVKRLITDGKTVTEACNEVELSRSTYYAGK